MVAVNWSGPIRAERASEIGVAAVAVLVAIGIGAFFHSLIGVVLAGIVILLLVISVARSRKGSEAEMIRRQDRTTGKPPDDPRKMGNFLP